MRDGAKDTAVRRRILLVDDIELNRILTQAVLSAAAYEVDSVDDGAAALRALEAKTYDLVLMDLDMPGLGGHEATAAILRRDAGLPKPTIVALSALDGAAVRDQGRGVGMEAHIRRPIKPPDLVREIERLLAKPRAAEARAPIWCRATYDEIADRLGADRMRLFNAALVVHCETMLAVIAGPDAAKADLERKAHDLVSVAGMLGFEELSRTCFEAQRLPEGPVVPSLRAGLVGALDRAIEVLRRTLGVDATGVAA